MSGPFCKKHKIYEENLKSGSLPTIAENQLNNGMMLEIFKYSKANHKDFIKNCAECISKLLNITVDNISLSALKTKLYNLEKNRKSKGGRDIEAFLQSVFRVPSQTVPQPSLRPATEETSEPEQDFSELLSESQDKIKEVKHENKLLKRKLERRDCTVDKFKKMKMHKSCGTTTEDKGILKNLEQDKNTLQKEVNKKDNKIRQLENLNETVSDNLVQSVSFLKEAKEELNTTRTRLNETQTDNDYLMNILQENETIMTKDEKNSFSSDMVECVMNILSCNVASGNVPHVITHVAKLARVKISDIPSRQTVDRINDARLAASQRQIQTLADAENLTLYSDETSKFGKCFEVFAVTDQNKDSYLLGMREMHCKSASTVLDTFKEIVADIGESCKTEVGKNLVTHIKNTMSDRAATEKKFHVLLEDYRSDILPEVVKGWNDLDDEEREKISKMNNFFCGLHLLVNFADICATALKDFERLSLKEGKVGAETEEEVEEEEAVKSEVSRDESGTIRLIRCCCKAFSKGGDEKCGVYGGFRTFVNEKKEKVHFQRFKHNRFNVLFLMGGATYHHLKDVQDFLENIQGGSNRLLRSIMADVQVSLFRAGARALGLISKVVTGPLWREIEKSGHIMEMGDVSTDLQEFLQKAKEDSTGVICGTLQPFQENFEEGDKELFVSSEETDMKTIQILQCLFGAMDILLKRQAADHLPGGKFAAGSTSNTTWEESSSSLRHNKLPEFFFGQLDFLMKYRPNATMLCNEAFLLFSHNKTGDWLAGLQEDERSLLLKECRTQGREIRTKFKERIDQIENLRRENLRKKEKEMKERKERVFRKKEKMTNDILYFGLWQSEEDVTDRLQEIEKQTEKIASVKAQLNFRKNVLHQVGSKELFQFSKDKKKFTLKELISNLTILILEARKGRSVEKTDNRKPLLVGKKVSHCFSDNWYIGQILSVVPNFVEWYNIKYDHDPAVYVYKLQDDYEAGNLKIVLS